MLAYLKDCQSNVKKELSSLVAENIPSTHGGLQKGKYTRAWSGQS